MPATIAHSPQAHSPQAHSPQPDPTRHSCGSVHPPDVDPLDVDPLDVHRLAVHPLEQDRLRALAAYAILDTPTETAFSTVVDSAAALLHTSRAAISFIDSGRQWCKATHGPALPELPRDWSLANDVINTERALVVSDLRAHPDYRDHPSTLGPRAIRSYAGLPLVGRDGLPLGVLSVSDETSRTFNEVELVLLSGLAEATVALLERRRNDLETGRAGRPPLPLDVDPACFSAAGVRQALAKGEVEVHFQPIVSIPSGQLTGVEALARWNMPGVGLVPPQFFLPHVEASPLLSQAFTTHVLQASCSQLATWRQLGASELRMSVNVSGYDVTGGNLPSMVANAVAGAGVPYASLTLEITETVNLRDREVAISHLGKIRALGVRVTLDDFGVGYSSLEHAGLLPISGLKLDRDFVAGLFASEAMTATLDSVVQLCRRLQLELVGEGVETQQVADLLVAAGVTSAQGYHFSRPVSAAALTSLIDAGRGEVSPVALEQATAASSAA